MTPSLTIVTASANEKLYAIHRSFLNGIAAQFRKIRVDIRYFESYVERCSYDTDYTLWLDDDVFIYRPESILDLVKHMEKESLDYLGFPEKGYCGHRTQAGGGQGSLCAFFVLCKNSAMRSLGLTPELLAKYKKPDWYEHHYTFFYYLQNHGMRQGIVTGRDHSDKVTTILTDMNGKDFAFHTWYARAWEDDQQAWGEVPNNTARQKAIISEAQALAEKESK